MTTKLKRRLVRETSTRLKHSEPALMVALEPEVFSEEGSAPDRIQVWVKGTRRRYEIPVSTVFLLAARRQGEIEKEAKARERRGDKPRRVSRGLIKTFGREGGGP